MSTRTSASATSAWPAVRAAVTVIAGFRGHASQAVADRLLATDPTLVLVQHDLTGIRVGEVQRTVRTRDTVLEQVRVALVHGCVSCTLREDVLPTLVRLGRSDPGRGIVLLLPEVVEPGTVAGACATCLVDGSPVTRWLRFDSYITVVDSATLLADLDSTDDLSDRDIQAADADERGLAEVVVRQIEHADTVLLWEEPGQDPAERLRHRVLAHRLAPWAVHGSLEAADNFDPRTLRDTGRHQPELPEPVARGLEGYRLGVHQPAGDWGVNAVMFRARRPMHPQRLHRALESLAGQVLRARGHLWLATHPQLVLGLESAGAGMTLGSLGHWLVAADTDSWQEVSDMRRLTAAFDWDPYYGDRGNTLALVAVDIDPVALHRELGDCLLSDAELAAGQQQWARLPDPFAPYFTSEESP